MKPTLYQVELDGKNYSVEILDIDSGLAKVRVNGKEMSVHYSSPAASEPASPITKPQTAASEIPPATSSLITDLVAPLPGKVVDIFVKDGDSVEKGQVILVIEAMKMKNSIRSTRSGKVKKVHVSQGQTIAQKTVMVEFDA